MHLKLYKSKISTKTHRIAITGSKSESNRLLLLQALYPGISIKNLSNSDDTVLMQNALQNCNSSSPDSYRDSSSNSNSSSSSEIDIHHAGTAMRFLTAYFATKPNANVVLTGSKRMKQRPIKILVSALQSLGADISYVENEGYPPLKIKGNTISHNQVSLQANVSSQYISALLLVAPQIKNGIELTLQGKITSIPYINMTLNLLNQIGVETQFFRQKITVKPLKKAPKPINITVESDWSSASYWYSIVALSDLDTTITLSSYKKEALQGDSVLAEIYTHFGVSTTFEANTIILKKIEHTTAKTIIDLDLANAPDIAQTIAVTAFGLGLACNLKGLHTLKIKETDRLVALQNELLKFNADITITKDSLALKAHQFFTKNEAKLTAKNTTIKTYNDHRMAMAFAPLALKLPLIIEDANVVSKSYPEFWEHLKQVGFKIEDI